MANYKTRLNRWLSRWAGLATGTVVAFFFGMTAGVWISPAQIDGGIATLVGGFLGAFAAVFGAIYAAERSEQIKRQSQTKLLADTLDPLRQKFKAIDDKMIRIDIGLNQLNLREEADGLLDLLTEAEETKTILFELMPSIGIPDYAARLHLMRLRTRLQELDPILKRERGFLDYATKPVLENSIRNFGVALEPVIEELQRTIDHLKSL